MLTQTPSASNLEHTIREAIAHEHIDSLDALVKRLASSSLARIHDEDHLMAVADAQWDARRSAAPPKPHRAPDMLLVVDGERHDPTTIVQFNGRALYSTPGRSAKGDPVLYSFSSMKGLHDHLLASRVESDAAVTNPDSLPVQARYA